MAAHDLNLQEGAYVDPALLNAYGSRVVHGFFGRQGGVSLGVYKSLNCAIGAGDDPERMIENRERVQGALGADHLLSLYQEHGSVCLYVDEPWDCSVDMCLDAKNATRPHADAFVTDRPKLALGILTADCAPVLFSALKKDSSPIVGAAHAGWGGAYKGVLEATLDMMHERGALLDTLCVCIGPCISKASYEVGEEFLEKFIEQSRDNERFFMGSRQEGHFMFDLAGYCASRLARCGVKNISICGQDTYSQPEKYFSYRRSTHRSEPDYGRQIATIMIL